MKPPREWSEDEKRDNARQMAASTPTAQIRAFQQLNAQQIGMAHKQRNTNALANLRAMAEVYAAAVDIREFPPNA